MKNLNTDDFETKVLSDNGNEYVKVSVKSEKFAKTINKYCGDSSFAKPGIELFLGTETFNKIIKNFKKEQNF